MIRISLCSICVGMLVLILSASITFSNGLAITKDLPVAFINACCYQLPDGYAKVIPAGGACSVTTVGKADLAVVEKHWDAQRVFPLNARQSEVLLLVADGLGTTVSHVNEKRELLHRWFVPRTVLDNHVYADGKLLLFPSDDPGDACAWLIDCTEPNAIQLAGVKAGSKAAIAGDFVLIWHPGGKTGTLYKDGKFLRAIEDQLWLATVCAAGHVVYVKTVGDAREQIMFVCVSATGSTREIMTITSGSGIILTTSADGKLALIGNEDQFGVANLPDGAIRWKASLPIKYSSPQHAIDNNGVVALWEIGWIGREGTRIRTKPVSSRLAVFDAAGKSLGILETTPRIPGPVDIAISLSNRTIDLVSTSCYTRFSLSEGKND